MPINGHGTRIAGTIGSKTYGVAKKTQVFAVKVLNEYTAGQTSGILAGMDPIVEDAATRKCPKGIVVNMSFSAASSAAINTAAIYIVKLVVLSLRRVAVDAFALGTGIKSTWIKGGVKVESCTSMATSHVTGFAAYLLGLKDIKASELCNLIASMSLKDVIKGIS
ncbi:serine protease precursor [Fusarium subglutinans]|uniref:Serine protease n=1 Tax=Gibberella subglutinans TaxID=42677 RepID=A0A8H5QCN3_GIBSU|nr:serine protease precursor [Fusarium subglutinans]KAF5611573.1 serine protease precursor [Fusarium subglutinans]